MNNKTDHIHNKNRENANLWFSVLCTTFTKLKK